MDGDPGSIRNGIIEKLSNKASLNQQVFDNTFSVFGNLKEVLHEMSSEIDDTLEEAGKEARIEYRDRGTSSNSTASTSSGRTLTCNRPAKTPTAG